MDNATVATIVANIAYMSKAAEGTFICHEDPTCSAISCVDIWYAQNIFGSKTTHYIRLKPVNQIIHLTLIDCGNGSNELYTQQSTTSSFLNLCARGIDADFFVVYVHRYVHV